MGEFLTNVFMETARVFYEGSLAKAVTGLVGETGRKLTSEELDEIEAAIAAAREKARRGRK